VDLNLNLQNCPLRIGCLSIYVVSIFTWWGEVGFIVFVILASCRLLYGND